MVEERPPVYEHHTLQVHYVVKLIVQRRILGAILTNSCKYGIHHTLDHNQEQKESEILVTKLPLGPVGKILQVKGRTASAYDQAHHQISNSTS